MAAKPKKDEKPAKPLTTRALNEQLQRVNVELALAEATYMKSLFGSLQLSEAGNVVTGDADEASWVPTSSGGALTLDKTLAETRRDPAIMRRQAYRFWRLHPHARGILRNFQRFIIGRELGLDFADEQHGVWADDKRTVKVTNEQDDPLAVRLVWDDFVARDHFVQRAKELVLRTFRDGEAFLRRFERNGRVRLRFIEPEWVATPASTTTVGTTVQPDDVDAEDPDQRELVGKKTVVTEGVEHLEEDVETVIAYHVRKSGSAVAYERVPAKDVIHAKALADSNDVRGIPLLEVVAKRLTNYDQWEDYRMVLNKARTAIWLVRRIEGTATQAAALLAGRASPRPHPQGREPVTTSGRREAMPQPGTILNPSAGVKYEYLSPNLDAKDASEDGRRFQLSIAAGVGLPEMLVTGDWSNANFASAVEARTPAVREWEDWQDFFEPHFKTAYRWVIEAGKRGLGLPPETSVDLTIQWPSLIAKDNAKETERNVNLNTGGILSRTTWAAREDLIYEDELDNMRVEAELEVAHAGGGDGGEGDDEEPPTPTPGPTLEAQLRAAAGGLRTLGEQIDSTIEDPALRTALKRYVRTARAVVAAPMGRLQRTRRARRWRMGR